jgi:hypothetical protein
MTHPNKFRPDPRPLHALTLGLFLIVSTPVAVHCRISALALLDLGWLARPAVIAHLVFGLLMGTLCLVCWHLLKRQARHAGTFWAGVAFAISLLALWRALPDITPATAVQAAIFAYMSCVAFQRNHDGRGPDTSPSDGPP